MTVLYLDSSAIAKLAFEEDGSDILAEYIEVTKAFYAGREAGVINGVLDHLAHKLRPDELDRPVSAPVSDDEPA